MPVWLCQFVPSVVALIWMKHQLYNRAARNSAVFFHGWCSICHKILFGSYHFAVSNYGSIRPARLRAYLRCWTHLFLALHKHRMKRHSYPRSQAYNQIQMMDEDGQVRKYDRTTTESRPSPDLYWRDQRTMVHHGPSCFTGDRHARSVSGKVSTLGSPLYFYTWPAGMDFYRHSQCDLQQWP